MDDGVDELTVVIGGLEEDDAFGGSNGARGEGEGAGREEGIDFIL